MTHNKGEENGVSPIEIDPEIMELKGKDEWTGEFLKRNGNYFFF